ncbi:hypothetical protein V7S43_012695 [Phytophthora oleae]|uniref:Transmembrane protein n=1 Tax=Phytophthora oleae TaxID=2107226 RepID=A0ABD3F9J6_9STRA
MMSSDQYEVIYTLRSEMFAKKGLGRCASRRSWMENLTPAERKVLLKCRKKGARRGVLGALMGALAMAGVWKIAALGTTLGVAGVIAGGLLGAWMAMRASRMRLKTIKKMLRLPSDKSPLAAEAREILKTKLPDNAYAKKLLKKSEFVSQWKADNHAPESSKDK